MSKVGRWAVGFVALAIVLGACTTDPAANIVDATPRNASPTPSDVAACEPGRPVKIYISDIVGTTKIKSRCPASEPVGIGESQRIVLGSVTAKLPCKELPDFAGSWWRVVKPYPKHLAHLGHDYLPGKMTLESRDRAAFRAKAIELHMGKRTVRFPAKGNLELNFKRIEGPAHVGGCD